MYAALKYGQKTIFFQLCFSFLEKQIIYVLISKRLLHMTVCILMAERNAALWTRGVSPPVVMATVNVCNLRPSQVPCCHGYPLSLE